MTGVGPPPGRWYAVEGLNPEPWEAAQTSTGKKGGKTVLQHRSTEKMRQFKEGFPVAFKEQNPRAVMWPSEVPIYLRLYIWREVPQYETMLGNAGSGNYADATNMQKLIEDCLQGLLFDNDRGNVDVGSRIMAQGPDVHPIILIFIGPDAGNDPAIEAHAKSLIPKKASPLPPHPGARSD